MKPNIVDEHRWLVEQVEAGLRQLDRGEVVDGEQAFSRIFENRQRQGLSDD